MANVYLVTSGEYSDYSIDAVFSTMDLAKAWIALHQNPEEYSVEPWEVDKERDAREITIWRCGILLDTGEIIERGHGWAEICVPFRGRVIQNAVPVPFYNRRLVTRVESGISAKHARKLAIEAWQARLRNEVFQADSVDPDNKVPGHKGKRGSRMIGGSR